ncbi:hypothetical protein EJB05_25124, partial [Eragrostis curvula]
MFRDDGDDGFVYDDFNLTVESDTEKASDYDDSDSNSFVDHSKVLYLQCLMKIEELEKLKKKLSHSLFHQIPNVMVNWDTYVEYPVGEEPRDMEFDQFKLLHPQMPRQDNL